MQTIKLKENARHYDVRVKVTEREKELIKKLAKYKNLSVSDLLRISLNELIQKEFN